jgi:hypothetical protein
VVKGKKRKVMTIDAEAVSASSNGYLSYRDIFVNGIERGRSTM